MTNYRNEATSAGNPEEGVVCTLFEGDYHFGLAALINSLTQNGFQGCIAAGYRGALPPWISQLKALDADGAYEICPGVRIELIHLETPVHFANFKPQFMQQLIRERHGCQYICYFDPDIVIRCSWSFYVEWIKRGVALCEDVNFAMPENHPIRYKWMELVSSLELGNPLPLSRYYNSGFVGLPTACSGFLDRWQATSRIAESEGLDTRAFATGDRTNPFYMADQDALNIAAMYSEYLGTDGSSTLRSGQGIPRQCQPADSLLQPRRPREDASRLRGGRVDWKVLPQALEQTSWAAVPAETNDDSDRAGTASGKQRRWRLRVRRGPRDAQQLWSANAFRGRR